MEALSERVLNYLAQHVVQDFREGRILDNDLCRDLNSVAPAQHLRKHIKEHDVDWLVSLLSSGSQFQRKLALDMTKPTANHLKVKKALLKMWDEESDESVRQSLLFAILNIEDLNVEQRRSAFNWIRAHQDAFNESVANWYGGREKVLDTIKLRSEDPSFIKEKHWIYLCCALASTDKDGARQFIKTLPGDNGPLIQEVREYALARLDER